MAVLSSHLLGDEANAAIQIRIVVECRDTARSAAPRVPCCQPQSLNVYLAHEGLHVLCLRRRQLRIIPVRVTILLFFSFRYGTRDIEWPNSPCEGICGTESQRAQNTNVWRRSRSCRWCLPLRWHIPRNRTNWGPFCRPRVTDSRIKILEYVGMWGVGCWNRKIRHLTKDRVCRSWLRLEICITVLKHCFTRTGSNDVWADRCLHSDWNLRSWRVAIPDEGFDFRYFHSPVNYYVILALAGLLRLKDQGSRVSSPCQRF